MTDHPVTEPALPADRAIQRFRQAIIAYHGESHHDFEDAQARASEMAEAEGVLYEMLSASASLPVETTGTDDTWELIAKAYTNIGSLDDFERYKAAYRAPPEESPDGRRISIVIDGKKYEWDMNWRIGSWLWGLAGRDTTYQCFRQGRRGEQEVDHQVTPITEMIGPLAVQEADEFYFIPPAIFASAAPDTEGIEKMLNTLELYSRDVGRLREKDWEAEADMAEMRAYAARSSIVKRFEEMEMLMKEFADSAREYETERNEAGRRIRQLETELSSLREVLLTPEESPSPFFGIDARQPDPDAENDPAIRDLETICAWCGCPHYKASVKPSCVCGRHIDGVNSIGCNAVRALSSPDGMIRPSPHLR